MSDRAHEVMDYLYSEGDVDIILFGYVLGLVSSDGNDNLYKKSPRKRLTDAIALVRFLLSSGDFKVGKTFRDDGDNIKYEIFSDFEKFIEIVNSSFLKGGIDDVDLITQTWLKKIIRNDRLPKIPEYIEDIFK